MELCRICLSKTVNKDVSQLRLPKKWTINNNKDIMMFCLDIEVTEDSKVSKKLCLKCYRKIISFSKFKSLALKNDAYLRSQEVAVKHEVYVDDDIKIDKEDYLSETAKHEEEARDCESNEVFDEIKKEIDILDDDDRQDYESDDEFLSVIKKLKNEEYVIDETKENDLAPVKKRGRPKRFKSINKPEERKKEVCDECGQTVWNLKEHAMRHLPLQNRKLIKCKACDKMFTSYSSRYKHHKIKHLGIKKHCDICDKDVVNLKHHHQVMHDSESLPFQCVPCGRRFISPSALDAHMTTHTKDRPHECSICQKSFRTKLVMIHHKRQVHDKEKTHLCQFCSKSFFKKYHLQIHLRSHTKEKPYECSECGKFFASTTGLNNHKMIHSDVKMFECNFCDSSFVKPGYLRNHMLCHTKEKRHPCKYCGVRFGRSDHRKRHEFTAHEKHIKSAYTVAFAHNKTNQTAVAAL